MKLKNLLECEKIDLFSSRAGKLGHSLGSFADSMLGQLTGQQQPDSGLDLTTRNSRLAIMLSQLGRLGCDALKDIKHK